VLDSPFFYCLAFLILWSSNMASGKGVSLTRLKTIYQRQQNAAWDASYKPGIWATPQEAPAISRAYILTPAKLAGREVHLLSTPERDAALLGFYHPDVVGLQEQRMLSPEPSVHPLWSYPGIDRSTLPALRGVIDVADRFGYLDLLPRVWAPDPDRPGEKMPLVFPWCGDLLWAISKTKSHVYCVNWSVKGTERDFSQKAGRLAAKHQKWETPRTLLARHEIEAEYYKDVGIRTIRIPSENIDRHVADNLRQLFLHHRRLLSLDAGQREEILAKFHNAMRLGISPTEVIMLLVERRGYSVDDCRSALYQAIWNRDLRVDLFRPILINCPLRPEVQDVIQKYADWFREEA